MNLTFKQILGCVLGNWLSLQGQPSIVGSEAQAGSVEVVWFVYDEGWFYFAEVRIDILFL
jgi:hypothetical protein